MPERKLGLSLVTSGEELFGGACSLWGLNWCMKRCSNSRNIPLPCSNLALDHQTKAEVKWTHQRTIRDGQILEEKKDWTGPI